MRSKIEVYRISYNKLKKDKNMKIQKFLAIASIALLASCAGQPSQQDYIDAFVEYEGANIGDKENITIAHLQDITVADSIAFLTNSMTQEYQDLLEEKKLAWEKKLEDCEKDERANILRHEDYMKKYEAAKRQYGNNIKYKNKIDGYLKAAQKLPSTHEEYLKFDRSRSYSFTRDAENLQADYEQTLALTLEGYAAQAPSITAFNERNPEEVVASAYTVNYTSNNNESLSEVYIFSQKPIVVLDKADNTATNILNYNAQ